MTNEQHLTGLLVILTGGEKGKVFSVDGPLTVGRSEENEVTIDDSSVSRVHARIEPAGDKFLVTDLGSRNRITVGKAKVRRCELSFGEEFSLGNVRMKLLAPTPEERTARQPVVADPQGELPVEFAEGAPVEDFFEAKGQQREKIRKVLITLGSLLLGGLAVYAVAPFFVSGPGVGKYDIVVDEGRDKALAIWEPGSRVTAPGGFDVDKRAVADVKVDSEDGFIVKVTGKTNGVTKAEGRNRSGGKTIIYIVVRIRADEEWKIRSLPDREQQSHAMYLMGLARDIESHSPYEAMQKYGLAARVLEELHPRPKEYSLAVSMEGKLEKKIDDEFEECRKDYVLAVKAKNWDGAALRLRKIIELIPDPDDYRNQRASLYLKRIGRMLRSRRT